MKRSLKELKGYSLQAIDGDKGKVKNFLFDDETLDYQISGGRIG